MNKPAVLPDFVPDFNSDADMERWRAEYARLNTEEPMSEVPVCPIHKTPMSPSSKGGGFYCPKKGDDGKWCSQKVAGVVSDSPRAPAASEGPPSGYVTIPPRTLDASEVALAAAALRFTSELYGPGNAGFRDAAIETAVKTFRAMKAVMS